MSKPLALVLLLLPACSGGGDGPTHVPPKDPPLIVSWVPTNPSKIIANSKPNDFHVSTNGTECRIAGALPQGLTAEFAEACNRVQVTGTEATPEGLFTLSLCAKLGTQPEKCADTSIMAERVRRPHVEFNPVTVTLGSEVVITPKALADTDACDFNLGPSLHSDTVIKGTGCSFTYRTPRDTVPGSKRSVEVTARSLQEGSVPHVVKVEIALSKPVARLDRVEGVICRSGAQSAIRLISNTPSFLKSTRFSLNIRGEPPPQSEGFNINNATPTSATFYTSSPLPTPSGIEFEVTASNTKETWEARIDVPRADC